MKPLDSDFLEPEEVAYAEGLQRMEESSFELAAIHSAESTPEFRQAVSTFRDAIVKEYHRAYSSLESKVRERRTRFVLDRVGGRR